MLVQIRCAFLGCKGIQPVVSEFLWEHCERCGGSLVLADVNVNLRIRIELLRLGIALKNRQAIYGVTLVAILRRLSESDTIFKNRTGERESRRRGSDAHDRTIRPIESRKKVLRR